MTLFSAKFTVVVIAEERVFGALWADTELLDLLIGLTVEPFWLWHVVSAEESL